MRYLSRRIHRNLRGENRTQGTEFNTGTILTLTLTLTLIGLKAPNLTPAQYALKKVKYIKGAAGIVGISIGCLIGMFPLLFIIELS